MSFKDKLAIILIVLIVVILSITLNSKAGFVWNDGKNDVAINCEYDLAAFAKNNATKFVTDPINKEWFIENNICIHNVSCECGLPDTTATIRWSTAHCINHNGGSLIETKAGKNSHIVDVIDIKWNQEEANYNAWIICGADNKDGYATATRVYKEEFIRHLAVGSYLAATESKTTNSGNYGLAFARVFYNNFKNDANINEQFRNSNELNARKCE